MSQEKSSRPPAQPLSLRARIDRICDHFETRLQADDRPRIAEFLTAVAENERPELLRELLRLEIEYRHRQGEVVRPEDYLAHFPGEDTLIHSVCYATRPAPTQPFGNGEGGLATLRPGARPLPEYELIRKLGEGGFGEVWQARGPGGKQVALKFIRLNAPGSALEQRSLDLMANVKGHPNLVGVFGVWRLENRLILAMELCDGSLLDRLKEALKQKLPGIPQKELVKYIRDAANGLDALNQQGVQHRDVKPANLLLLGNGVKVADFGLAKVLEGSMASNSGSMTPAYTTPESFEGKVAAQSDQYSLAMTYYHLRTGKLLFSGSAAEIMHCHLQMAPNLVGLLPAEQAVVARALSKQPEKRWPSCEAFANELIKASESVFRKWGKSSITTDIVSEKRLIS